MSSAYLLRKYPRDVSQATVWIKYECGLILVFLFDEISARFCRYVWGLFVHNGFVCIYIYIYVQNVRSDTFEYKLLYQPIPVAARSKG